MDPKRYNDVCRHFETASALQGEKKAEYLEQLSLQDSSLADEVRELLRSDEAAEQASFLEESVPGYSQLTPISRGGQGTVYRAVQNQTSQQVAVKIIATRNWKTVDESRFRQAVDDFAREIQTVATLRHPNIVRIYDAGECAEGPFFVMELIEGGTLAENQQRLNSHKIARILHLMAEAVAEAHANSVLHLDIKPQNILYDAQLNQPFLVDFGLARLVTLECDSDRIAGTLAYMAPEQFTTGRVDERTDVFGLGATMFYLLTGGAVRQSSTIAEALEEHSSAAGNFLDTKLATVNRELAHICRRCLVSDPEKRYQSVQELASDLERFRETEEVQHISDGGKMTLRYSWTYLVINAVVYYLIRIGFPDESITNELLTWGVVFLMYPAMFSLFYYSPMEVRLQKVRFTMHFLWSIWIAKMFAAIVIAVSMRIGPAESGTEAILLSYPMFAALSGMAVCCMAPRLWRALYLQAAGMWLAGIAIMITLSMGWQIGPLILGVCSSLGMVVWGIYLRNVAKDLSLSDRDSAGLTDQAVQETILFDS